jgi:hypothetical protein
LPQAALECLAVDVLHDEVVRTLIVTDVVQRADVRMVELADQARFALEAFAVCRGLREPPLENFDRYPPSEASIGGGVNLAHASSPKEADYSIGTELCACEQHGVAIIGPNRIPQRLVADPAFDD